MLIYIYNVHYNYANEHNYYTNYSDNKEIFMI